MCFRDRQVVRVWNQVRRCAEFGYVVGTASDSRYLYVRTTAGVTKRFRVDRTTALPAPSTPVSSTPGVEDAHPGTARKNVT